MDTVYDLLSRAKKLSEKNQVNSITPEEVGKLHEDTLAYIASLEQSADSLGIKKVYRSKLDMEADTAPIGTNGKTLRFGQLVSVYDGTHPDSPDNGKIYAYQKPGWLLMGELFTRMMPNVVQDAGDSAAKVMSQQAVTGLLTEYNVSSNNGGKTYTLQDAIAAVPSCFQKGGLVIGFIDSITNLYVRYYNQCDNWTTSEECWRPIGNEIINETRERKLVCGNLNISTGSSFRRYKLAPKNFIFENDATVTKIIFGTSRVFPEDKKVDVFEYSRGNTAAVNAHSLTLEKGKNYIECNLPFRKGDVLMVQNQEAVNTSGDSVFLIGTNYSFPMFGIDIFGRWTEQDTYGGAYDLEYKEIVTYNAKSYADKTAKNAFEEAKTYVNERTSQESNAIKSYVEENVFKDNIKTRLFGYDYLGGAFNRRLQILSAGDQKPFNVDVRITKLIFRDEIANIVNEDKEIKVYDCRFGVNDKIEYTATLKANTNYAVCDFTLRNGSVVMVQDIKLSENAYLITTLYEAKGYCIDQFNRWVATSAHSSRFSFEYQIRLSKLDEILNGEGNVTSYANTDFVIIYGSSLTDHSCSMRGHSWCEKVNDIVDIPISNHALSGSTLSGNIGMLLGVIDTLRPSYVWWNNEANGTKYGKGALPHLKAAKEICDSFNAKMILGGENGTAVDRIKLKDIDKTYEQFAKDNGLIHSELRREIPNVGATYKGFDSGVHQGYRNQACFFKHVDAFNSLRIMKSVKIFIVRPKSADKNIHELCYDDNYQRLLNFRAASSGTRTSKTSGQIDNLDDARYVVDGGTDNGTKSYEVDQVVTGGSVTCFKKAVVEVITDTIGVTSGTFVVGCDIRPTGVYIARVRSASTLYDGDVRSKWESVGFEYEDNNIIVELGRKNADIQLYDKIRFIVVCEGAFNLSKPIFKDYDGSPKIIAKSYEQRQYGTELNDNVLMADGWTLSGAFVETAPNALGLYKADTSHVRLGSKGDNATKSIAIPKGTRRVAIRIVAQRFLPIATKRFESNAEVQNSGYITSMPAIEAYDNDTSLMGVLINDAAYSERLVHQGWYTDYLLYDTDMTDDTLKIELSKISDDTAPIFVYSVSVQKVE